MAVLEPNYFDLFVTCVDKVGPLLKIWGQVDRLSSMFVEQLLKTTSPQFEAESGLLHLSKLTVGLLCGAKYKDGHYYRAQITNLRQLVSGSVEVKFVDYGNVEVITVENIRLLENVPLGLTSMKPQAVDFILANVFHIHQQWDDKALSFIHSEIAYMELKSTVLGAVDNYRFIKVMFHETDLSEYLIQRGIATPVSLVSQENLVRTPKVNQVISPQFSNIPAGFLTRSGVSQPHFQQSPMSPMISTPELCSYKTLPLEPNSEHMVYISYVEDGPYLFSIQLQSMEDALEKLMIEINQITNLLPLSESPLPGYPCMARCLEDSSLCRAVVINLVEDKCKTYYVDFGNTDILPFSNIFQIPFKYMLPKVMSMRFTLAGLKNIKVTNEMKCSFKEFVTNRLLKLKVLKLESSPVLQYCELYDENNMNIINILYDQINEFKTLPISKGMKYSVIVSFIEGCKKFFVQLKECSDSLNKLMLALANTCEGSAVLQNVEVGSPCVAFYSGDNQWYRAIILSVTNDTVTVKYVDYGNEDTVSINCLKKIDPNFVKVLPAQAIECCLYGYQNMSFNNEIESVFESLTLECEFTMRVISKQNNDTTLLVDLFDAGGNNVAALLIEKLASQKSQLSPLPANKITRAILNNEENMNPNAESQYVEIKSPKTNNDKPSWRNSANDKSWQNAGNENNYRNSTEEKKSWRNTDDSVPKNRAQNDSWNGDSPTNKRSQKNERSFSRSNNSNQPREREGGKFNKRSPHNDSGKGNSWNNSGSESEKSCSGGSASSRGKHAGFKKDLKQGRHNDFPKKNDFGRQDEFSKSNEKRKLPVELPPQDLAPMTEPFNYMEILPGTSESISISWFYNPENFFTQLSKNEKEFRDMMNEIQSAYNGRQTLNSNNDIPIGASVIAEFHEDSILYRATVLENKYPKYKVQYVDFGNMSLVDNKKIWQVEKKFMILPMQAIKCCISNIKSSESNWPVSDVIDNLFNKESFTASFVGCDEEKYFVQLFDKDVDIRQNLIDSGIAIDPTTACQMVDDPVDLNILIGQNIRIKMSYIQGLNKFYVHLQQEKAAIVQESVESFMNTTDMLTLPQLTEDLLSVGATCLVQVNEKWKRGVVTDHSDVNSIQIEYPDFGGSDTYSLEKIYALPQELCAYWYQGFECSLHNLSDEANKLVSDEDFKNNYEDQELIIYVDEIVNTRLIVTLYDTSGTKLELIDPDEDAYPTVEPLCPMPILNATFSVYVSHVNSVGSLYLQRESDSNKIAALLESLFQFYESKSETAEFNQGDLCCAKSEDGNWYRSRVIELNDETAKVLYIDYGNNEDLPKDNLKILDQSFYSHELAIHAGLSLQEISPELTNKISELTTDKLFTANIFYGDSGWIVDLMDGEINLNQILIDLNLALSLEEIPPVKQETIIEETESELVTAEPVVINESRAQITITHIDSPSEFYVQLIANEDSIFALQADLQEKVKVLPDLEGADVGVLCAAKYTVDEQWYRAEVLDADAEITTVRFIDYGNTDVIANNQESIKMLPADLLAVDKYARKCSLNVMPNKGEEWTQEASEIFENAVNVDVIHADIVYQDEKNKTYIDLFVNGNNVAEKLLNANLALPITRDDEDNIANNTGFVSHVNSISEFWIQLESSVPDLEMIVDRLANADSFADLQDLSPGILCAANFPDDEMWYRARILSNTVAGIEVLFVDYGNSSTAMKLKVLPEDLVQMPILGQKCSLNKPSNLDSWSEQANEKFREISEDGATIFTIRKLSAGETSAVELFVQGDNIIDQLIDLCDEKSSSSRMTPIGQPDYPKIHITHIETPYYFWIQLSSDSEKIEDMTETLAAANSYKKLTDWDADTTCAALYEDSGLWYRSKIIDFTENYEVLLIDYGNTIVTKELRILPEDVVNIPPLATLCSLELPKDIPDWTEEMCSKFANLIDGCKEYRIEFIYNDVPSIVRLFVDGKSVAEEICTETPKSTLASNSSASLISDEVSLLAVNTHLPEPVTEIEEDIEEEAEVEENINEVTEVEQTNVAEISMMDESFLTAKDETEENFFLDDSTETVKEASFIEAESVISTETNFNQDNNSLTNSTDLTNKNSLETDEQETVEIQSNKQITSNDERIVAGFKCGIEENLSEDEKNINEETDAVLPNSRPTTPHCDKIVPGSICRGDLEEPVEEDEIPYVSNEIDEVVTIPSRPITPHSEKIVPGSISRGSKEEIPLEYINENINIPVTQKHEKIVAGAICRGDLEEPPEENEIQNILSKEAAKVVTISSRPITPHSERIVAGAISRGDLEEPPEEKEIKNILSKEVAKIVTPSSRPITPHSERIVAGAISRGDLEEPPEENEIQNILSKAVEKVVTISSRPITPHSERIVAGAICRGDLEEPPEEKEIQNILSKAVEKVVTISSRPITPHSERIVAGAICRGDLEEPPEEKEIQNILSKAVEKVVTISSRPITPHSERIVAGAICRGDLEEPPEEKEIQNILSKAVEKVVTISSRPITPHSERIVAGAICRGDLEEPPEENEIQNILSKAVEEVVTISSRPITPHSERIVAGAFCRGDLEEPPEENEIQNILPEVEKVVTTSNRPLHSENIVTDSICRGFVEEISTEDIKENVKISIIPTSAKNVAEATCAGDLEEPPTNTSKNDTEIVSISETLVLEELRPKTPIEEKIESESINKEMDLKEI